MNHRFEVLDAFRGIAAICVVVFHMHLIGSMTELEFFRGSSLFVEFFFVLSGFVLVHTYAFREGLTFKNFLINRTFRLYPLHIFMFLVFVGLEFGKLIAYKYGFVFNNEPFTNHFAPSEIVPNLLFLQSWLPFAEPLSFNFPAWSLSVEYYMYMIFFITLLIKSDFRYTAWFIISLLSFVFIINTLGFWGGVFRGLSCFFAGGLVYMLYRKIAEKFTQINSLVFSLLEITSLGLVFYVISFVDQHKGVFASFVFLIVLFIFAFEKGVVSKILKMSLFQLVGKLSYSIYMVHAAVLFCTTSSAIILAKVLDKNMAPMVGEIRYLDFGSPLINNIVVIFAVALVVFCSMFTYKYIEDKWRIYGKKLSQK